MNGSVTQGYGGNALSLEECHCFAKSVSGDRRGVITVRKTVYSGFSLSYCHRLRNETAFESVWQPLRKRNLPAKRVCMTVTAGEGADGQAAH